MRKINELIDLFQDYLDSELWLSSKIIDQKELKYLLKEDYPDEFPMTCYEYTNESEFEVSIDESKFLNDETHSGDWIMIQNICVMRIEPDNNVLEIDSFEIGENYRNEGFGRKIIEGLEHVSKSYYDTIRVIPFDENAKYFWKHLEYKEDKDEKLYKKIMG